MQHTYYTCRSLVFLTLVLLYRLCLCVYPVVVMLIIVDIIGPLNYKMTFAQPIAKLANMMHHVIIRTFAIYGSYACVYTTVLIHKFTLYIFISEHYITEYMYVFG